MSLRLVVDNVAPVGASRSPPGNAVRVGRWFARAVDVAEDVAHLVMLAGVVWIFAMAATRLG